MGFAGEFINVLAPTAAATPLDPLEVGGTVPDPGSILWSGFRDRTRVNTTRLLAMIAALPLREGASVGG